MATLSGKKRKRRLKEREGEECHKVLPTAPMKKFKTAHTATTSKLKEKLHRKMATKMDGARFRWINEQLYTIRGEKAKEMFDKDPELFDVYHRGFATQTSKWPTNPLDRVITHVCALPNSKIIADFGCGEAKLSQSIPHTVHSFDLVAANEHVTACDMAHVPLPDASVDVCVFCLSLMGTNLSDFIKEARRVLKSGGKLWISEITSRFISEKEFEQNVERLGFKLISKKAFNKLFLEFEFKAVAKRKTGVKSPNIELKPCIYKRR